MTPTGLEQGVKSSGNQLVRSESGTESGTVEGGCSALDAELQLIASAWPTLPEVVRRQIVATVNAVGRR